MKPLCTVSLALLLGAFPSGCGEDEKTEVSQEARLEKKHLDLVEDWTSDGGLVVERNRRHARLVTQGKLSAARRTFRLIRYDLGALRAAGRIAREGDAPPAVVRAGERWEDFARAYLRLGPNFTDEAYDQVDLAFERAIRASGSAYRKAGEEVPVSLR